MKDMEKTVLSLIDAASHVVIIQAENPDGDSLGSAVALEYILSSLGKEVSLYCQIDIPSYLRYIPGWDRVTNDWPSKADLVIVVDTSSETLLLKTLAFPHIKAAMMATPVIVIDHHQPDAASLPFDVTSYVNPSAVACGEVVYDLAVKAGWDIPHEAAEALFAGIQADSLGLTTPQTTADSYRVAAALVELGVSPSVLETRRREYLKKPAEILNYKGRLIERIEYHLDGALATVHIPWEEIQAYSQQYNPSILVLEEMRMVEEVQLVVAIKTYPDGKLTGKIRGNLPIAHTVAGFFGGGGHEYSAGFKVYESYETIIKELVSATDSALKSMDSHDTQTA